MFRSHFRANLLLFLIVPLMAACTNPVSSHDDHDEHAEAQGIRLVSGSTILYQVLEGQVSCTAAPCGLTVAQGQSLTDIVVEFLDANGLEIHEEDLGPEFTMTFTLGSSTVAEVTQTDRFALSVSGVASGSTAFHVVLNHNGHADLTTPPLSDANAIRITVTP